MRLGKRDGGQRQPEGLASALGGIVTDGSFSEASGIASSGATPTGAPAHLRDNSPPLDTPRSPPLPRYKTLLGYEAQPGCSLDSQAGDRYGFVGCR